MIKRECENLKALEIADNLEKEIQEMCPDILKVWIHCYAAFPATMEIALETFCTDFINPDYLGLEREPSRKTPIRASMFCYKHHGGSVGTHRATGTTLWRNS